MLDTFGVDLVFGNAQLIFWASLLGSFGASNLVVFLLGFECMTIALVGQTVIFSQLGGTSLLFFSLLSLSALETVLVLGLFVNGHGTDLDETTSIFG